MKHRALGAMAVAAALAFTVAACGDDDEPASGGGGGQATEAPADAKVGVILPDAASSARWETADRDPERGVEAPASSPTSRTPMATRPSSPRSPTRC